MVVDNPKRRLDGHLPDGVEIAIQEQPRGTGDAVAAAAGHIDRGAPVVIVNGDMPLITAEAIAGLVEAHSSAGAAATLAAMELEDPAGYGRVVRDAEGGVERVVETKTAGDATEAELAIREVNAGLYCFDGGALLDALERPRHRQRAGRALPPRRRPPDARQGPPRSRPTRSPIPTSPSASTTASTSPTSPASPSSASTAPTSTTA